jgi:putative ABC transport system ATP-binding protein
LADEPTGNLDSKTRDEVVDLFKRLNREDGQTFVMITHDENMLQHAHRVFHMLDGKLGKVDNNHA